MSPGLGPSTHHLHWSIHSSGSLLCKWWHHSPLFLLGIIPALLPFLILEEQFPHLVVCNSLFFLGYYTWLSAVHLHTATSAVKEPVYMQGQRCIHIICILIIHHERLQAITSNVTSFYGTCFVMCHTYSYDFKINNQYTLGYHNIIMNAITDTLSHDRAIILLINGR